MMVVVVVVVVLLSPLLHTDVHDVLAMTWTCSCLVVDDMSYSHRS